MILVLTNALKSELEKEKFSAMKAVFGFFIGVVVTLMFPDSVQQVYSQVLEYINTVAYAVADQTDGDM
jgi:hypothetical protein